MIVATGQLHREAYPRIEGLDGFDGHSFHSARWDHDYDLRGKRVAVVGTGASAVQFVPEIATRSSELDVFQRTRQLVHAAPQPLLSGADRARRSGTSPGVQALPPPVRLQLRRVADGDDPPPAHARPAREAALDAVHALAAPGPGGAPQGLARLHVRLQAGPVQLATSCRRCSGRTSSSSTDAITAIDADRASGPPTATEHEVDCIIWGTGFRTNDFMFPMEITGAGGRSLRDEWEDGAHAHLGITVPGFPSLFLMYGPNTNTSGGSIVFYLEAQAAYIRQALQRVRDAGAAAIAVRPEVEARERPRDPGALRRDRLARVRLLVPRTRAAGSSPTGRATCASTRPGPSASIPPTSS